MLSKFALLFLMAAHSSLETLGVYGLYLASVILINYFAGLEFHRFTARELIGTTNEGAWRILVAQTATHIGTYVVLLPFVLLVFLTELLPRNLLYSFLVVSISSHISLELSRLLVVLSESTRSYIVSFFTNGMWALIGALVLAIRPAEFDLGQLFWLWALTSILGVFLGGFWLVNSMDGVFKRQYLRLQPGLVKAGLKVSSLFFLAAVAYKVIDFSDRYFISYFHGEAAVGIYTFYASVANVAYEFVYTGIVVTMIPTLILSSKSREVEEYVSSMVALKSSVIYATLSISIVLVIGLYVGLHAFNLQPELIEHYSVFIILVLGCGFLNINIVPYYRLYLGGRDGQLLWTALAGMSMNLLLNSILIPNWGVKGAAVATTLSLGGVFFLNSYLALQLKHK